MSGAERNVGAVNEGAMQVVPLMAVEFNFMWCDGFF